MPTVDQISDKIFRGQLVQANLALGAIQSEVSGAEPKCWGEITCLSQLIQALTTQVLGEDYVSEDTINIYNQLTSKVGFQFIDGATLDPDAQQTPGVVFIGKQPGQVINFERIPFTDETNVTLANYQGAYYAKYGNSPSVQSYVSNGLGGFNPDFGNVPDFEYLTPGDENSGIASISWLYPVATTGYISIFGIAPTI